MNPEVIALQLYTIRDQTAPDFRAALRRVAEIGYRAVEFAGYEQLAAGDMRRLLGECGLKGVASHVSHERLRQDLDGEIEYALEIGCRYLVVPGLVEEWRHVDRVTELASWMNESGRRCSERGARFGYHTHDWEVQPAEGGSWLDRMMGATDASAVALEFDVYWASFSGVDPTSVLRTYTERVPLLHVKDMTADGDFTEVGDGTLPWTEILTAAGDAGVEWYIVEHDQPTIPSFESAERSLRNLERLG